MSPTPRDSGQAAPLYIAAVTGLLFIALVFFAFGEADVQRNGAQTAADAAALAAAKESRSLLEPELKANLTNPDFFASVFNAPFLGSFGNACGKASEFAGANEASDVQCRQLSDGRWGYEVRLKSNKGMSTNVVPGTEGKRAEAEAVAVVEPRCTFIPAPDSDSDPDSDADAEPDPDGVGASIGKVRCDGDLEWAVGPEGLTLMPDVADLFSVHLAEN